MNEYLLIFIIGMIVFSTATVEAISGFGSTVLALPFIVMLVGVEKAVPLLSTLGWILGVFIVIRSWRNISWRDYGFIVFHVGLGLPVGLLLMDCLPRNILIGLLVCFMLFVGIKGIVTTLKHFVPPGPVKKNILMRAVLFCGGIIHGAFSSGGPFVVIYASRALPEKALFRVTLSMLWVTTNTIMLTKWTLSGRVWTPQLGWQILLALPFVAGGMIAGDFLHHKVNERIFKLLVFSVLIAAALSLGGNMIWKSFF